MINLQFKRDNSEFKEIYDRLKEELKARKGLQVSADDLKQILLLSLKI
jgi:hypothetical protein